MVGLKVRCVDDRQFLVEQDGVLRFQLGADDSVDLTKGKIYEVLAVEAGWYRLIDDTGEDYLYPPQLFEDVDTE